MTGVAFAWVTRLPFLGSVTKAHHVLAADRDKVFPGDAPSSPSGENGLKNPKTATDTIAEYQRLRADNPRLFSLLVFPESTTKAWRSLVQFRTGVFVSGQPVQPVVLRFPNRYTDVSWVQSIPAYVFKLLTRWVHFAEVLILPIYVPSDAERADPRLYADGVQRAMARAMDLPEERYSNTTSARDVNTWLSQQKRF